MRKVIVVACSALVATILCSCSTLFKPTPTSNLVCRISAADAPKGALAEIYIDGNFVHTAPVDGGGGTFPLTPGSYVLKVVAQGYAPYERTVTIVKGTGGQDFFVQLQKTSGER